MSGEQKEEMEEMVDVEPISSVATPTRVKEKSLGGKKVTAPQCQTKAAPVEPSCQCTPPKKGNQTDPIKGNRYNFPALENQFSFFQEVLIFFFFFRGKLILLIWSVTLVILWVIIYSILTYFDVV